MHAMVGITFHCVVTGIQKEQTLKMEQFRAFLLDPEKSLIAVE
jgi:hypothetical protein